MPAITVIAAAPAMAASGVAAITITNGAVTRNNAALSPVATVTNTGGTITSALTAVLTITVKPGLTLGYGTSTSTNPTGWTLTSSTTTGLSGNRIFTYTAVAQLAAGASLPFAPTVTLSPNAGAGTASLVAMPGGTGTNSNAAVGTFT